MKYLLFFAVNGKQNIDISHLKAGRYFIKDKYARQATGIQFIKT